MNTAMFTSVRFSSGVRYHLAQFEVHAATPHFAFFILNFPSITSTSGVVDSARKYVSWFARLEPPIKALKYRMRRISSWGRSSLQKRSRFSHFSAGVLFTAP
jgi:hypothetical protein